jgi:hypothetical protein
VRRPTNSTDFNGTAIVEWANVSSGYEILAIPEPLEPLKGFVYVSVSAQHDGIYGFVNATNPMGLKDWDPVRYGNLSLLDDGLSYDIFTQGTLREGDKRRVTGIHEGNKMFIEKKKQKLFQM